MEDLKLFKCKTCGEALDLSKEHNGVITCDYCGATYVLPKKDGAPEVRMLLIQGEHDLDTGKFDDAYAAYAKAAEKDPTEPEAYWGMALAKNGIQYLLDEKVENIFGENGKRLQPICHRIDDEKFTDDRYYLKALDCATPDQRTEYERRAAEIDHIKREFYRLKQTGLDYDCFICVKVSKNIVSDPSAKTAESEKTPDSEFAHQIYRMLKGHSYVPFYSEAVLTDETGADYEAHILYALATSETMLVICFDESYLDTKWVKNEYSRFLKLVNDEEKESDSITVVYKGKPIEKLPGKRGKIQGINADDMDCSHRVLTFVDNHTPETQRKRAEAKLRAEEEARRRAEEEKRREDEARANAERIKKLTEEARLRDEEFRKTIEELKRSGTKEVISGTSVGNLLELAQQHIRRKNYDDAKNCYQEILKSYPKNAEAWYGMMMLGFKCRSDDELAERLVKEDFYAIFKKDETANMVIEYADAAMQKRIEGLFEKRKNAIKNKIEAEENSIAEKREKIAQAEKDISRIEETIGSMDSEISECDERYTAKQEELRGLNGKLSEKKKQAQSLINKSAEARRKSDNIDMIDYRLVGGEFLEDFWLDEGASFTLANIWEAVIDKADDICELFSDFLDWEWYLKVIFLLPWLALHVLKYVVYPLALVLVMLPVIILMGLLSLLILFCSIPVNLFILILNLIGKCIIRKFENNIKTADMQVENIMGDSQKDVDRCQFELSKIFDELDSKKTDRNFKYGEINLVRHSISKIEDEITYCEKNIKALHKSLDNC